MMMAGQMAEHTFASLPSFSIDQLSSKFFWHQSDRKVLLVLSSVWKSIIKKYLWYHCLFGTGKGGRKVWLVQRRVATWSQKFDDSFPGQWKVKVNSVIAAMLKKCNFYCVMRAELTQLSQLHMHKSLIGNLNYWHPITIDPVSIKPWLNCN